MFIRTGCKNDGAFRYVSAANRIDILVINSFADQHRIPGCEDFRRFLYRLPGLLLGSVAADGQSVLRRMLSLLQKETFGDLEREALAVLPGYFERNERKMRNGSVELVQQLGTYHE